MKNSKRLFILIEAVLAAMVIVLAFVMLQEKNGRDLDKVSVIIPNSDDNRVRIQIRAQKGSGGPENRNVCRQHGGHTDCEEEKT